MLKSKVPVLETERLILRRFTLDDTDAVLKNWASDEKVQSLYSEPVYECFGRNKAAVTFRSWLLRRNIICTPVAFFGKCRF